MGPTPGGRAAPPLPDGAILPRLLAGGFPEALARPRAARLPARAGPQSGLRALAELAGRSWVRGVVLHLGRWAVSLAPGLTACPVEALWG